MKIKPLYFRIILVLSISLNFYLLLLQEQHKHEIKMLNSQFNSNISDAASIMGDIYGNTHSYKSFLSDISSASQLARYRSVGSSEENSDIANSLMFLKYDLINSNTPENVYSYHVKIEDILWKIVYEPSNNHLGKDLMSIIQQIK